MPYPVLVFWAFVLVTNPWLAAARTAQRRERD